MTKIGPIDQLEQKPTPALVLYTCQWVGKQKTHSTD